MTASTENVKVVALLSVPSLNVMVMEAVPDCSGAGVMATVLLAPAPPNTILATGAKAKLLDVALSVRPPTGLSISPTIIAFGPAAVSSRVTIPLTGLNVGASLTGFTVKIKVLALVSVPSLTVTIMLAVPD